MKVRMIKGHELDQDLTIGKVYECSHIYKDGGVRVIDDIGGFGVLLRHQYEIVEEQTDKHVESVIERFRERSEVGMKKYGKTLERNDLSTLEWLNEAQAEAMDFCLYLERLKEDFKDRQL